LIYKCDILINKITVRTSNFEDNNFADSILKNINTVKTRLKQQLNRLKIAQQYSITNTLIEYKNLSREIQLLEFYAVPAIHRCNEEDKYFNRILKHICNQIKYPLDPPFGSTLGQEYYFCYIPHNIILGPCLQAHSILNLPDLFHELGHFIFDYYKIYFIDSISKKINDYFYIKSEEIKRNGGSQNILIMLERIKNNWNDPWLMEFSCDIIATYLTGVYYGWANLHLCANSATKHSIYFPDLLNSEDSQHPSDDSRMQIIFYTLEEINESQIITDIKNKWASYVGSLNPVKPGNYDFFYPKELQKLLITEIVFICRDLGLIDYSTNLKKQGPTNIITEIKIFWDTFLDDKQNYSNFANQRLLNMKDIILK
jgi:hypothetical protein